jgi:uncharacterized protein
MPLRPASETDHPGITSLLRDAFAWPAHRFGSGRHTCPIYPDAYDLSSLARDLRAGYEFHVWEDAGQVLGCVAVRQPPGGDMELSRLGVHPGSERRGIGSRIVAAVADLARQSRCAAIQLSTIGRHHVLLDWFLRRGFRLIDAFEVNDVSTPLVRMVMPISGPLPWYIRRLDPGDEKTVEAFLLQHRDSSVMLLSNLRRCGLVAGSSAQQGLWYGAFEDDRLVGLTSFCGNGTLLPQAARRLDELIRVTVAASTRPMEGVVGPADQAWRVSEVLGLAAHQRESIMLDSHEILYALDLQDLHIPPKLMSGQIHARPAEPRDMPMLTGWIIDSNAETYKRRLRPSEIEANLERMAGHVEHRWVLEQENRLLATTGFGAGTEEVVQVAGVYTPPNLRNQGFARCVVAASLVAARDRGVTRCVLFTAIENIPAQHAYEALGFERIGEFRLLVFNRPVATHLTNLCF